MKHSINYIYKIPSFLMKFPQLAASSFPFSFFSRRKQNKKKLVKELEIDSTKLYINKNIRIKHIVIESMELIN